MFVSSGQNHICHHDNQGNLVPKSAKNQPFFRGLAPISQKFWNFGENVAQRAGLKISMGGASPLRRAGSWRSYSYKLANNLAKPTILVSH